MSTVSNKDVSGGRTADEERPPSKAGALRPNETIAFFELDPARAAANSEVEIIPAPDVPSVARQIQPEGQYAISDVRIDPETGNVETLPNKRVVMRYGADDPDRILDDFTKQALTARLQSSGSNGEDEIGRRIQLRLRLNSVQMEQLLARTRDRRMQRLLENPAARKQVADQIKTEIDRIREIRSRFQEAARVEAAEGE